MPSLLDKIKRAIPEGRNKDVMRYLYHRIHLKKDSIKYSLMKKMYHIKFTESSIAGSELFFPWITDGLLLGIKQELPCYFKLNYIEEGSIVIDAGAFPLDFSTIVAKMFKDVRIIALEPNPISREYSNAVARINGIDGKIEILNYGLSNYDGIGYLKLNGLGSKIIDESTAELYHYGRIARIETRRLDTILDEKDILSTHNPKIVVKMDIEGSEIKAIEGASKTISNGSRFIIAAYHEVNRQQTYIELKKIFEDVNYKVDIVYPHLTLFASPK